jgi:3-hydroxyethyl bacteriochlorophyllide a dehydrogenase
MKTVAVVLQQPEQLQLQQLELLPAAETDIVVDVEWSGISTGTERLFWTGRMPHFPGMGYPLVPGYESLGHVTLAGAESGHRVGERVFVPGSRGFKDVRGLFGGAASTLVVAGNRAVSLDDSIGEQGVLLALAATARHALVGGAQADLIVGHGVLGRLLARLCVAMGGAPPVVWESRADRAQGASGYEVVNPDDDKQRDYKSIYDVSGDATLLDKLIQRLAPGGEIVLAGFYSDPLAFAFPPAFMREARIRVAAEWRNPDLLAVKELVHSGRLSLDGLITHRQPAQRADDAYRTAFEDPSCLKMILDWRSYS